MNLRATLGRAINGPASLLGLQVLRASPELRSLPSYHIKTVLDIGAHGGEFLRRVRPFVPKAVIHCFEPLPGPFARLQEAAARDPRAKAWRLALGDMNGLLAMHENAFTPSSSFLPMTEKHIRAFPGTACWKPTQVSVTTLDDWASSQELETPIFVKMDVQGYEAHVICGGHATIGQAVLVLAEVSFVELYAGQCLFEELHDRLRGLGFRCVGMANLLCDPISGRALQADALFAKG
jgi:FkbM family methyltransferase